MKFYRNISKIFEPKKQGGGKRTHSTSETSERQTNLMPHNAVTRQFNALPEHTTCYNLRENMREDEN